MFASIVASFLTCGVPSFSLCVWSNHHCPRPFPCFTVSVLYIHIMPSLRGRYFIDCLKRWTLAQLNLALPVPPYGTSQYWDHAYRSMLQQPDQVEPQEWGDASYETLKKYHYKTLSIPTSLLLSSPHSQQPLSSGSISTRITTITSPYPPPWIRPMPRDRCIPQPWRKPWD